LFELFELFDFLLEQAVINFDLLLFLLIAGVSLVQKGGPSDCTHALAVWAMFSQFGFLR
jgi:hypothetical protein